MTDAVVVAEGLHKSYGDTPVLRGVGLTLHRGEVLALLGPNGAGKTTTVKILSTLLPLDGGSATVAGYDVVRDAAQVRRHISLTGQQVALDLKATGLENLTMIAKLSRVPRRQVKARVAELLDGVGLADVAGRRVATYSGGMRRRLDLAAGLIARPRVLFLDEPTTGLDPEARAELWAELSSLAQASGMTVLLTTHYLDEADRLADQVVIIDHGRAVTSGTPDQLKDQLHGDGLTVDLASAEAATAAARIAADVAGLREITVDGSRLRARATAGASVIPTLLGVLDAAGLPVLAAGIARPSLDDVYLHHTGHAFDAGNGQARQEVAA